MEIPKQCRHPLDTSSMVHLSQDDLPGDLLEPSSPSRPARNRAICSGAVPGLVEYFTAERDVTHVLFLFSFNHMPLKGREGKIRCTSTSTFAHPLFGFRGFLLQNTSQPDRVSTVRTLRTSFEPRSRSTVRKGRDVGRASRVPGHGSSSKNGTEDRRQGAAIHSQLKLGLSVGKSSTGAGGGSKVERC